MFIISSFLASERGKPALNLKDGVHDAVSYPHSDLKHYPSLEEGIKHCQSMGKKVLLSIEDDFSRIKGDTEEFARLLWQLFGPNVTADNRPFGTAVVDGFHLSAKHYNYNQRNLPSMSSKSIRFVQSLRYQLETEHQGREYLLSASFPCQFLNTQMPIIRSLQSTFFDMAFVKDYGQTCQFTLDQWDEFLQTGPNNEVDIYLDLSSINTKTSPESVTEELQSNTLIGRFSGIAVSDASCSFAKNLRKKLETACGRNYPL